VQQALETSERHADNLVLNLGRLPDLGTLQREILRAGNALGNATVNALSARAARVFAATVSFLGRAFGHRHDRGMGRDDDGLGLGR
jgi:hypothetical protein